MRVRFLAALAAVAAAAFVATGSAAAASNHFCNNDVLAPGDYLNVSVTGFCNLTSIAGVHIHGSLFIQGGSSFNGATGGFLIVDGGISVSASGVLILDGFGDTANMRINHGINADRPNSIVLHFIETGDGVQVQGGGGNKVGSCERSDVPLTGVPYINLEDSFLAGNLTWNGYHGCWDGFFRNTINGSVTLTSNTVEDPDGNELADNSIGGNLFCKFNTPMPQTGDSGGGLNIVGGSVTPSCSFVV